MRIANRSSGGRGEWELAGVQGDIDLKQVADKDLIIELIPGVTLDTHTSLPSDVWDEQGKPRLRRESRRFNHAYLPLSGAALMPKPKRDWNATSGGILNFSDNDYSIHSIKFDIVKIEADFFIISPTDLVLTNSSDYYLRLDFPQRMRMVMDLWAAAREQPTHGLTPYIERHRTACRTDAVRGVMQAANAIRGKISGDGDPLPILLDEFGASSMFTSGAAVHREGVEEVLAEADVDERNVIEAAKARIRKYREQAVRGAEGRRFRREVREAYGDRCLMTGYYLPSTELTSRAGVDAAHVLPWADYDLNVVTNGICLNKLCHWALDEGILRLDYDAAINRYVISIPGRIKELYDVGAIDLSAFASLQGEVPRENLPSSPVLWPSPDYIAELNKTFPY